VKGNIHARWIALKDQKTPDGDDVQAHLEEPIGEQTIIGATEGGGAVQMFKRGMLVERADGRTFVVYGAIFDHYAAIGGARSAIGLPVSDEEAAQHGARVNRFDRGDIYWRLDFGPRVVQGRDRERCNAGADPFARSWITRAGSLAKRVVRRALG
jgi:uncharacterized protein with LGFP repeats